MRRIDQALTELSQARRLPHRQRPVRARDLPRAVPLGPDPARQGPARRARHQPPRRAAGAARAGRRAQPADAAPTPRAELASQLTRGRAADDDQAAADLRRARACSAASCVAGRWPWELATRVDARSGECSGARKLLGVSRGGHRARRSSTAHRRLVTQVHPDRGGTERPGPRGERGARPVARRTAARDLRSTCMTHQFHPTVLREYDIRGIIGETLGPRRRARDRPRLRHAAAPRPGGKQGGGRLRRAGQLADARARAGRRARTRAAATCVRIGMGPTPMLYYAEASAEDVDGGIQITGSHNPANYNGFKMVFQGRPFFGEDIQELGRMARGRRLGRRHRHQSRRARSWTPMSTGCWSGLDGHRPPSGWPLCGSAGTRATAPPGPALEALAARLPGEHSPALHRSRRQFSQPSS